MKCQSQASVLRKVSKLSSLDGFSIETRPSKRSTVESFLSLESERLMTIEIKQSQNRHLHISICRTLLHHTSIDSWSTPKLLSTFGLANPSQATSDLKSYIEENLKSFIRENIRADEELASICFQHALDRAIAKPVSSTSGP